MHSFRYALQLFLMLIVFPSIPYPVIFKGNEQTPIHQLKVSPNGQQIATLSQTGKLCIWNSSTKKKEYELPGEQTEQIEDLAWHPDSTHLALSKISPQGIYPLPFLIQIWNSNKRQYLNDTQVQLEMQTVDQMVYSPDGKFLSISGQDNQNRGITYLINLHKQSPPTSIQHTGRIRTCCWHPHRKFFVTMGEAAKEIIPDSTYIIFDPEGHMLGISYKIRPLEEQHTEKKISFWMPEIAPGPTTPAEHELLYNDIFSATWSADGRFLATIDDQNIVSIWDPYGATSCVTHFKCPLEDFIKTIKWPKKHILAIGDHRGIVLLDPWAKPETRKKNMVHVTLETLLKNVQKKPQQLQECIHAYDIAQDGNIYIGSGSGHVVKDEGETIARLKLTQQNKNLSIPEILAQRQRGSKTAFLKTPVHQQTKRPVSRGASPQEKRARQ